VPVVLLCGRLQRLKRQLPQALKRAMNRKGPMQRFSVCVRTDFH
jgi:hypothetical protein